MANNRGINALAGGFTANRTQAAQIAHAPVTETETVAAAETPKAPKRVKSAQINIRVTQEQLDQFNAYCAIKNITVNHFVWAAISEKMERLPVTESERHEYIRREKAKLDNLPTF